MTLTRRQTLIGAAATVAAAALPASKILDVARVEVSFGVNEWGGHKFWICEYELTDPVVRYIDRRGYEWAGGHDFIDTVRALDAAEVVSDHPYELEDIPEIA